MATNSKDSKKRKQPSISNFFSTSHKKTCTTNDSDIGDADQQSQSSSCDAHEGNDSTTVRPDTGGLDIADIIKLPLQDITNEKKFHFIKNRQPEKDFKFPPRQYKDSSEAKGVKQRYCLREWFEMYDTLCYSKSTDGVFCLCCVFFPATAHHGKKANKLVTTPYRNWKDARADFSKHGKLEYHRDSKTKMDAFIQMMTNPSLDIQNKISQEVEKQVLKNRAFLTSIIKCIELCGRQGIGLRGHRDDANSSASNQGNFKALIELRLDAGDTELYEHLQTSNRNSTYMSKTTQNELLLCIKKYIQSQIINQVKSSGGFFGIEADEVTDSANWEQLGLVIRYLYNGKVTERLVSYIQCEGCTGREICDEIVQELSNLGLDPKMCRAQTYDGAGAMSGCHNGCAKLFQDVSPRAFYFHCASHELNLALSHASKVAEINNMVSALKSVGIFFKYSPKRQRELEESIIAVDEGTKFNDQSEFEENEVGIDSSDDSSESEEEEDEVCEEDSADKEENRKSDDIEEDSAKRKAAKVKIKPLCETRWVERHTAFQDFEDLYEPLLLCLHTISQNKGSRNWDAKSKTEAQGLFHQITKPAFIAAFCTAKYLFGYTVGLSRSLQGSTLNVVDAYNHINVVKNHLQDIRKNAKSMFAGSLKDKMNAMAKTAGVKITIPRVCGRQTLRSNVQSKGPLAYFRRSIFVPFLDGLLDQMANRFSGLSKSAVFGLLLIPVNLDKLDKSSSSKVIQHYSPDLPAAASAPQEMELWKRSW